jgi:hypothetical protein
MKKHLRLAILSLVAVALLVVLVLRPRPRVTAENYDRVPVGTSRADAEALLGPPATVRDAGGNFRAEGITELAWEGERGRITALVDKGGRIINRAWIPAKSGAPVERRAGD